MRNEDEEKEIGKAECTKIKCAIILEVNIFSFDHASYDKRNFLISIRAATILLKDDQQVFV